MKKFIIALFVLIYLAGCTTGDDKNSNTNTEEKIQNEMIEEYLDIVKMKLNSDNVGTVNGEKKEESYVCCYTQYVYEGEVSNNLFQYDGLIIYSTGEEININNTITLDDPSSSNDIISMYGMDNIYEIEADTCDFNDNTLVCRDESVMNKEFYVEAFEKEFIFTFDNDKHLQSISISHFYSVLNYFEGSDIGEESSSVHVDDELIELAKTFKSKKDVEIFNDVNMPVVYTFSFGTETILY